MYFQQKHGMHAILADWQILRLAEVFQRDKLEISANRGETPPQLSIQWEVVAKQTPQGAFFPHHKFLNIGIWPNYLFLYKEILQDLRQQLVFKTDIQRVVDMMMVNITMENMDKEVVFVGVHCRRTDYAHQLWKSSRANMVDKRYFDRSFDIYRSRYSQPATQVVFLVVSDDTAWVKENLGMHEDVRFGADTSGSQVKDIDLAGFDLCVLAACNHSVHT